MRTPAFGPRVARLIASACVVGAVAAGIWLLAGDAAMAQVGLGEERLRPPRPGRADNPPLLWNYLVLVIIAAAAITATMIPSKRGHQD